MPDLITRSEPAPVVLGAVAFGKPKPTTRDHPLAGAEACDALEALHRAAPEGQVDRAAYRTRMALPIAIGHLARSDRRALAWLIARARDGAATPFSYRHIDATRMGRILQRAATPNLAVRYPDAQALMDMLLGDGGLPRATFEPSRSDGFAKRAPSGKRTGRRTTPSQRIGRFLSVPSMAVWISARACCAAQRA